MLHVEKINLHAVMVVVPLCGLISISHAQSAAHDDTKQLVKKAIAHLKKNGIKSACNDFADPDKGFLNGEKYVFIHNMDGKVICHPTNAKLVGKDLSEVKDADGKTFAKDGIAMVKNQGSGWQTYRWTNPATQELGVKTSYLEGVGEYIVASGFYNSKK